MSADAVAVMPDGSLLVAGDAVRRIAPDGRVSRVAGGRDSYSVFSGDGGPATAATLAGPGGLAILPDGGFLIAEGKGLRLVVGPVGSDRLAAAIRPRLGTAWARGYRVRYALTKPERVTVRLYRSKSAPPSITTHAAARAGESTPSATRKRALTPGIYAVDLRADTTRQTTRILEYAYLGGRLTERTIRTLNDDQDITFTRGPLAHKADQDLVEDATCCHHYGPRASTASSSRPTTSSQ